MLLVPSISQESFAKQLKLVDKLWVNIGLDHLFSYLVG